MDRLHLVLPLLLLQPGRSCSFVCDVGWGGGASVLAKICLNIHQHSSSKNTLKEVYGHYMHSKKMWLASPQIFPFLTRPPRDLRWWVWMCPSMSSWGRTLPCTAPTPPPPPSTLSDGTREAKSFIVSSQVLKCSIIYQKTVELAFSFSRYHLLHAVLMDSFVRQKVSDLCAPDEGGEGGRD